MKKLIVAMSLLMAGCAPVVYTYDTPAYSVSENYPTATTTVTEYRDVQRTQYVYPPRRILSPYTTTNRWDPYYQRMVVVERPYYYRPYYDNGVGSFLFGAGVGYLLAR
jgi:hypothetical protein